MQHTWCLNIIEGVVAPLRMEYKHFLRVQAKDWPNVSGCKILLQPLFGPESQGIISLHARRRQHLNIACAHVMAYDIVIVVLWRNLMTYSACLRCCFQLKYAVSLLSLFIHMWVLHPLII